MPTNNTPEVSTAAAAENAPRKLSFAENAVLTAKVLGAVGIIAGLIWLVEKWTMGG